MYSIVKRLLMVLGIGLFSVSASGVTIEFDNLSSGKRLQDGYEGFNWSNAVTIASLSIDSGYNVANVSGENSVYNSSARMLTVSSIDPFNFDGAYLTGAWRNGLNIDVIGYRDGIVQNASTISVNTNQSTWFAFNFMNIDSVSFTSYGGEFTTYLKGRGTHFAMDNFTVNSLSVSEVPIPSAFLLLLPSMLGFVHVKRYFSKLDK